ncbi:MAG TPA: hypothetical protein VMU14_02450, partial [Acidimicrobiales bacterium]|nr:hypothetical protein [Acidimicrobiales bacterium]
MSEPGSASAMTPAPTARSSEGGEPTAAGRFEAIIIVNPDALAPKTMRGISALCAAGAVVALITTGRVKDLVERTSLRRGLGTVLIAAAADTSCTIIDSWGTASVTRSGGADEDDGAGGALGWVLAELWKRGIGRRDALLVGHRAPLDRLEATTADVGDVVRDQLARRRRAEVPVARPDDLWAIMLGEPGIERVRVDASLVALADGVMGTSGALVTSGLGEPRWAVAGGAYIGDGPETRLVGAPLVMHLPYELAGRPQVRRVLDLHAGTLHEHVMTTRGELSAVRFSSLARPGTAVLRAACPDVPSASPTALPPGEDAVLDAGSDNGVHWMRVAGTPGGIAAAAADVRTTHEGAACVDRVAAYVASAEEIPSATEAVARCRTVTALGFDDLLAEHRAAWARRWADADVVIEGDDELQRALRFSLFHLMASVPDRGEAAVGARGLTGTGYRGHVFWDADTFTLPFLAATHPASARAMLEYRLGRLAAACAAARELGRRGARFPWESAHTGRDVTPTSARDRAGRTVAIRTGHREEHIVAEVAFATCSYLDWSGDGEFAG